MRNHGRLDFFDPFGRGFRADGEDGIAAVMSSFWWFLRIMFFSTKSFSPVKGFVSAWYMTADQVPGAGMKT
jgi:hypothetical protein